MTGAMQRSPTSKSPSQSFRHAARAAHILAGTLGADLGRAATPACPRPPGGFILCHEPLRLHLPALRQGLGQLTALLEDQRGILSWRLPGSSGAVVSYEQQTLI